MDSSAEIESVSSSSDSKSWEVLTIIGAREGSRGLITSISVQTRVVGSSSAQSTSSIRIVQVGIIFRIIEQRLKETMMVVAKIETDRVIKIGVSDELVDGMFEGNNFAIGGGRIHLVAS